MIVVDASVAAKWLLPEDGTAEARNLLRADPRPIAPALIQVEVSGAITRQHRLGSFSEAAVHELIGRWFRLIESGALHIAPIEDDLPNAITLAVDLRHPLQDMLYLALARRLDLPLVTADRRLAERARSVVDDVRLLAT